MRKQFIRPAGCAASGFRHGMNRDLGQVESIHRRLFYHQRPVQVFAALDCKIQPVGTGHSQQRRKDRFRCFRRTGRPDFGPQHLAGAAAQDKNPSRFRLRRRNQFFRSRSNRGRNLH